MEKKQYTQPSTEVQRIGLTTSICENSPLGTSEEEAREDAQSKDFGFNDDNWE